MIVTDFMARNENKCVFDDVELALNAVDDVTNRSVHLDVDYIMRGEMLHVFTAVGQAVTFPLETSLALDELRARKKTNTSVKT